MAVPFIVLDGEVDRSTRIRRAILNGNAFDKTVRSINVEDVKSQWDFLCATRLGISRILELANGDGSNVNDAEFESIMRALNSYL